MVCVRASFPAHPMMHLMRTGVRKYQTYFTPVKEICSDLIGVAGAECYGSVMAVNKHGEGVENGGGSERRWQDGVMDWGGEGRGCVSGLWQTTGTESRQDVQTGEYEAQTSVRQVHYLRNAPYQTYMQLWNERVGSRSFVCIIYCF